MQCGFAAFLSNPSTSSGWRPTGSLWRCLAASLRGARVVASQLDEFYQRWLQKQACQESLGAPDLRFLWQGIQDEDYNVCVWDADQKTDLPLR